MIKLIGGTILLQAGGYLMHFLAFFILAKILGAEKQGILTLFRASGQIVASFLWLGMAQVVVYFVGQNKDLFLSALKNCIKLFALTFPAFILLYAILPFTKLSSFGAVYAYDIYLFIFIFVLSFTSLFERCVLSFKMYWMYNLFSFGAGSLLFVLSVLIWFVPTNCNRLTFAIISYVITYAILFIYGAGTIYKKSKARLNRSIKQSFFGQFKVGFRGLISSISSILFSRFDLFMVGYYLSFKEVGIYSVAVFSAEIVTKIPTWSASILTPMVASHEAGHAKKTLYLFYASMMIAVLIGVVVTLGVVVFPNAVSIIINRDFSGVEACVLLLLPRVIMQSGVGILAANLAGKGYPWYHPLGTMTPVIILVMIDMVTIPTMGIAGAAIGNSIAYIGALIIFWIGFRRYNTIEKGMGFISFLRDSCECIRQKYYHYIVRGHR